MSFYWGRLHVDLQLIHPLLLQEKGKIAAAAKQDELETVLREKDVLVDQLQRDLQASQIRLVTFWIRMPAGKCFSCCTLPSLFNLWDLN